MPVFPGVSTATEIMTALDLGLSVLKLFPASVVGGLAAVSALAAPFPDVRFIPTGGITAADAGDYLAHPAVLAVGGSWMVPAAALAAGDWATVEERSALACTVVASLPTRAVEGSR